MANRPDAASWRRLEPFSEVHKGTRQAPLPASVVELLKTAKIDGIATALGNDALLVRVTLKDGRRFQLEADPTGSEGWFVGGGAFACRNATKVEVEALLSAMRQQDKKGLAPWIAAVDLLLH